MANIGHTRSIKSLLQSFFPRILQVLVVFAVSANCFNNLNRENYYSQADRYKEVVTINPEESLLKLNGSSWNVAVGTIVRRSSVFAFLCGGVLLNSRTVLTSASCFTYKDPTYIQDKTKQIHKINAIARHPKYKNGSFYNDIALLRLEKPVVTPLNNNPFQSITFNSKNIQPINEEIIIEWDYNFLESERAFVNPVPNLKAAAIVDTKDCERIYRNYFGRRALDFDLNFPNGFGATFVCVLTDEPDACDRHKGYQVIVTSLLNPNDENSPMQNFILGTAALETATIYKFGSTDCYFNSLPAIYTRVSSYKNWIANHS